MQALQTQSTPTSVFVLCSTCGHLLPKCDAVRSQIMEAIDGDETNLVASNLRLTGRCSYECHTCIYLESLQHPPIFIGDDHFMTGYKIGSEEAKNWTGLETLRDGELVAGLKNTFKEYAECPNEEALNHSIGSMIGLLIGLAVFDATK